MIMLLLKLCFYIAAIPFILMWWTIKAIFGILSVFNPFAISNNRRCKRIGKNIARRRSEDELFRTTGQLMFWDDLNNH